MIVIIVYIVNYFLRLSDRHHQADTDDRGEAGFIRGHDPDSEGEGGNKSNRKWSLLVGYIWYLFTLHT